jgi:GGDEF domain-containing protein
VATIGYESSNRLLQSVAQRLGDCTRKGDTLVRLGGNAFGVLLQNLSLLPQQATSEAETVAGKILLALSQAAGRQYAVTLHHRICQRCAERQTRAAVRR